MRNCLLLLFAAFFCLKLQAQTTTTKAFSIGFELAIPSNSAYNIGVGASAKLELPIVTPLSFTLTGGFTTLFYKSNLFGAAYTPAAAVFIPLKAGLKYYFDSSFYIEGEAGTSIETNYSKQSAFAFGIGPGFIVPTGNKKGIDISFRYENWAHQLKQTGLRVAYRFGGN